MSGMEGREGTGVNCVTGEDGLHYLGQKNVLRKLLCIPCCRLKAGFSVC